ncbi:gamma-glutamyl phosphate reductase [Burkholderia sp. Leaf177]|uniref:acyl-CoA reductase n=1 Tax=Burkholderia sp. Leaf177 TaxID=1736287 RepID=UPI0006F3485F|nr:acyl-CoA reductase [Burkholderia sp. Leaf177]KQR73925.1 gamma-glutamyl phosphate reductase [Burkholderia sp. Leaf177]
MIRQLFPPAAPLDASALLDSIGGPDLQVGDERMLSFLDTAGQRLRAPAIARRHPELGALGAYLRRGHLTAELARINTTDRQLRFPRGLIFHVAPGNADTVFVYSWALAALTGNCNVVRLSARGGEAARVILDVLVQTLEASSPVIARTQRIISYDHSEENITNALSAACNLRVMWGGDRAIQEIRRSPLQPAARDLPFPNRSSFAAISADSFLATDATSRLRAVESFHSDAYLFDQAACSSPGTIFWVGSVSSVSVAQQAFFDLLRQVVEIRGPRVDAAMAIEKHVAVYGLAAEGIAREVRFIENEIAVVQLAEPVHLPRRWLGAGTFPQYRVASLNDIAPLLQRQDQTLSYFGFTPAEMMLFGREVAGRGIDRIVPMGRALEFSSIWDGHDLLREFTRLVTVD